MHKIENPSSGSHSSAPLNVLFMGTPDFALECLKKIYNHENTRIIGVLTQTDKKKGRGMKLTPSPVKVFAQANGIPVFQPVTLRDGSFEENLKELDPDLIIVAAYGKLLPQYVIEYPKYGCINAHASLLPKYRGAAPINRAIIDGENETGITAMYMDEGIDTGDIILKSRTEILPGDNAETLHDRLADMAGNVMCQVIDMLIAGALPREKQTDTGASYAPKITRDDCKIDFAMTMHEVLNLIRGLAPYPCAYTKTPDGRVLKVVSANIGSPNGTTPGKVISLADGEIEVSCGEGTVKLLQIIPEGKSKMSCADYIRGRKISEGDILG